MPASAYGPDGVPLPLDATSARSWAEVTSSGALAATSAHLCPPVRVGRGGREGSHDLGGRGRAEVGQRSNLGLTAPPGRPSKRSKPLSDPTYTGEPRAPRVGRRHRSQGPSPGARPPRRPPCRARIGIESRGLRRTTATAISPRRRVISIFRELQTCSQWGHAIRRHSPAARLISKYGSHRRPARTVSWLRLLFPVRWPRSGLSLYGERWNRPDDGQKARRRPGCTRRPPRRVSLPIPGPIAPATPCFS